ncbi:chitinase ii [Lucifera butyrica]|uniref:Chitinase ii n=1 Tax=Lucifera butyrica TaxID=1351585 RepID=A0A498R2B8_9FIRM|nr:glycosyl hydrolase family 18 protein [Lucifera butyrica]VBB05309.1 chitinase ii [Lucifera butyrica]
MRRTTAVIFNLLLLLFFLPVTFAAPAGPGLKTSKLIVRYADGGSVTTGVKALTDRGELLVPVNAMQAFFHNSILIDEKNGWAYFVFSMPSFRLETTELDHLLQEGVDLNFPLRRLRDGFYLNVYGLDKLLGFTFQEDHGNLYAMEDPQLPWRDRADRRLSLPRSNETIAGKINLVWDVGSSATLLAGNKPIEGLDVISPTWFAVVNANGLVRNRGDMQYVQTAHDAGYKVWALVSNGFDRELTHRLLADDRAQENVIRQMAVYTALYSLDGVNIDFENMLDTDRDRLTAFVRKFTRVLKKQGVTVSMDVTVPSPAPNWSACYDRRELARIVDYIMVMTYDETGRGSPVSGSVASLGWVNRGLAASLAFIPPEKLLLGLPFYTREWEETIEGGHVKKVTSKALSMDQAEEEVMKHKAPVHWLKGEGQFYSEFWQDNKRYRIWLEEERSIALKTGLVNRYDLAGVAAWRKGFEKQGIWDVLAKTLQAKK